MDFFLFFCEITSSVSFNLTKPYGSQFRKTARRQCFRRGNNCCFRFSRFIVSAIIKLEEKRFIAVSADEVFFFIPPPLLILNVTSDTTKTNFSVIRIKMIEFENSYRYTIDFKF